MWKNIQDQCPAPVVSILRWLLLVRMRREFQLLGCTVADRFSLRLGQAHSPVWLYVAKHIGVSPAEVSATWLAVVEHAAQATPKGSVARFTPRATAQFFGVSEANVLSIVSMFRAEGLIDGDQIAGWHEMQGTRPDRTATERKRRQRERSHGMSRRDADSDVTACHGVTSDVTACHDMSRGGDYRGGNTLLALNPSPNLNTPLEAHHAQAQNAGDVLQMIEQAGIRIGIGNRMFNIPAVRGWVSRGVTSEQITEAISRARRARERAGDPQPVNLGFLRCFVDDVIDGRPERVPQNKPNRMEDADERVAEFVNRHL